MLLLKHLIYRFLNLSFFLLFLFSTIAVNSQKKYPKNEFRNPLDIPIILAGTFGELRSNHFHSGIDIKTQAASGKKVHTVKEGYVSRIKISLWGYGKALYITHPNGYTSVYAHLKKFSPKIEAYIKKQQYLKKSYEIQLFPGRNDLAVSENEIVAYSGNTGGSSAPHLHFEIRDTKTEKIINPLLFGYKVQDTIRPIIKGLRATPITKQATVNQINTSQLISIKKSNNQEYIAEDIKAHGKIGLSIHTHDLLNLAPNKNGVYSISMYVNDSLKYYHDLETFAFSETKYINLLIDYSFYKNRGRKFQKTYIEPTNKLSIYKNSINNGYLNIKDQETYHVKIVVKDLENNTSVLKTKIIGDKHTQAIIKKDPKTPYYIKRNQFNVHKKGLWEIRFPKYTLYEDTYIDFKTDNYTAKVHRPVLPLHKKYTITYYTDSIPKKQLQYAYLAQKSGKYFNYKSTKRKENKLYTSTKSLGNFKVLYDSISPKIYKASFYNNQNISKHKKLSIHIKDGETGIKSYYPTIDGKWVLMEYEPKKNKLTFDLNDLNKTNTKHEFKVKVIDMLGNTKTYTSFFSK